jgi:hypothetical protein
VTDRERLRGTVLESPRGTSGRPAPPAAASGVNLAAGTNLVVLVRAMDGQVERVRTVADDCPIDANGQVLRWLGDVTAADSLGFLEAVAADRRPGPSPQNLHDAAISAIALHRDDAADAALDRLTAVTHPAAVRATAARWLASARGDHGFESVSALVRNERDTRARTTFTSALGRSTSSRAPAALLAIARSDAEPNVRSEAAVGYARLGQTGGVDTLLDLVAKETHPDTRARIVASLDQVPGQAGLPALLKIAESSTDLRLRKEAVRALSRSTDPRATAYLESVLRP